VLGFRQVYDYVAGKADWAANGLPLEGNLAGELRAGHLARRAATCLVTETVGQVRERLRAAGVDDCVVVNQEGIVLGRLRGTAWQADAEAPVWQVMRIGPSTVRPNVHLEELVEWMRHVALQSVLVTTSEGRLLGVVHRQEAEERLARPQG
jgi:Mg/Co/Ni transporter MgtE